MDKKEQSQIVVIGSTNTDMVVKALHLPKPGETIIGDTFFMNPGGKGANQAVAISRLGGKISFISKIGEDMFGRQSRKHFQKENIDISYLFTDPDHPSGIALITVDRNAENCIVVSPGANANLKPEDIENAKPVLEKAEFVLMQLEIPLATVEYAARLANGMKKKVILNPAPGCMLPPQLVQNLYLITPNETEAEIISGVKITDIESAVRAAATIANRGTPNVIITLGSKGALVYSNGKTEIISACKVQAIDTTAAGDVFNGALVVALSEGMDLFEAATFACKASAISVTRLGAQASAPYRSEINEYK